jgi:hypothetical protein
MNISSVRWIASIIAVSALPTWAPTAVAQDACPNRGQLDTLYCDRDGDLVADTPTDPTKLKDPSTLVWAYTPVEDPAIYANVFKPFTDHLTQCTGKKLVFTLCNLTPPKLRRCAPGDCISPVSPRDQLALP